MPSLARPLAGGLSSFPRGALHGDARSADATAAGWSPKPPMREGEKEREQAGSHGGFYDLVSESRPSRLPCPVRENEGVQSGPTRKQRESGEGASKNPGSYEHPTHLH